MKSGFFFALVLGCTSSLSWADQPPSKTDNEAFYKLRNIVNSRSFIFQEGFATLHGEASFCRDFMHNLKASTQIHVIEPNYRTDNLDDPALEPWRTCGENPNINEGLRYYPATGTRGFRIYQVDADNNPRNGLEAVLYSEWDAKDITGPAGFNFWDLQTCKSHGGAGAQQDDRRNSKGIGVLGDNYALLIKYGNRTWALTMDDLGGQTMKGWDDVWVAPENYYLRLTDLHHEPEESRKTHYACSWSTIRSSMSEKPAAKSAQ